MQTKETVFSVLPDQELVDIFFSRGGEICLERFTVPADMDNDAHNVLKVMFERSSTRIALHKLQAAYRRGKVDRFGRAI